MTLDKTDLQNFFKRLRKNHNGNEKISYYACGEYGTKNWRPHYHAILFGVEPDQVEQAWRTDARSKRGDRSIGSIFYGSVESASCAYVLKYLCKPKKVGYHKRDDRQREFSFMSKGIGLNYITHNMICYHKEDLENRVCVPLTDGKIASMPRYYKDRIYTSEQKGYLKGYFEWLTPIIELEEREKYPNLTDRQYQQMKNDQVKALAQKFKTQISNKRTL